jgi:hypothetical protein|nr:MAG TPA: hypothetical protein [Caudoviricetes sp.]
MPEVIPVGASVKIDVVDAGDLRAGMNLLDSTYLVCGVVSEIRRIYKDGGRGGHYEYRLEGGNKLLPPSILPLGCAVGVVTEITE